jgi:serine/threonine protein kinase
MNTPARKSPGTAVHDTERPPEEVDVTERPPPLPPRRPASFAEATNVGPPPDPAFPSTTVPVPAPAKPTVLGIGSAPAEAAKTRRCGSCGELYPEDFLVCPRDATPLVAETPDATADPLVGTLLGETYQIVRVVGEGGMGRVYEARHLRLKERRFAVKCLHTDLARNGEMAARFLREAESASSIKHPNVVDVFDVHHLADGTPYLVGEFLEGEELAQYVERLGPLEPRTAAKVARQVCQALAAAHARDIVHRDMKPENIFVLASSIAAVARGESRTLFVKVLDFGISKTGDRESSSLTKTGVIMGTPSYMAPEQARGRAVDHRADIYAVGACLYFMVTGRRPFDSDDPTSTLSMVLTEDPVRPRAIDVRIPEMLELVIQRAMAKDAGDRYATMADLDKALSMFVGRAELAIPSGHSGIPARLEEPLLTGTSAAMDVAKAIFATAPQSSELAASARPTIVLASSALAVWLIGATITALSGLVRVFNGGEITMTEAFLLLLGCGFAAATPIGLYVIHVRRKIWPNSVRAVQLASALRRTCATTLIAYGAFAILLRFTHSVVWRSSRGLASGYWDILLFVLSIGTAAALGGAGSFVHALRRRSGDRAR